MKAILILGGWVLSLSAWANPPCAPRSYQLSILDAQQHPILQQALNETERWCLLWNHSVAGFEVNDCFIAAQGQLVLVSTEHADFAAGLGHISGRGELVSTEQGGYKILNINEIIPHQRLYLRVGSAQVDHRLWYRKQLVSLSQLAAGQRVTIQLDPHPVQEAQEAPCPNL